MKQLEWKLAFDEINLIRGDRMYATVYNSGAWYTWDEDGIGMDNGVADNIDQSMQEASYAVIRQGLIEW